MLTKSPRLHSGGDQARQLRALVARRLVPEELGSKVGRSCQTVVIAGGKGGVGRSVIALNLAIALAQLGANVGLMDASPDLGNIELLCGTNGYWNLSHVMLGTRQLKDIVVPGPDGVRILSGASCLANPQTSDGSIRASVLAQLQAFERDLDWLIIDGSGGASSITKSMALAADDVLICTTPEPTAVAEAYSAVKSLANSAGPRIGLMVNQVQSEQQGHQILDRLQQAAHSFLSVNLHRRGMIPLDAVVPQSVRARIPLIVNSPESTAAHALRRLAEGWPRQTSIGETDLFLSRLQMGHRRESRTTVAAHLKEFAQ